MEAPVLTLLPLILLAACGPKKPTAQAQQLDEAILALPGGGSSAWDDQVAALMVKTFDANGSGSIDTKRELGAVPCAVWQAMDQGIVAGGHYSALRSTYGFAEGYIWVGHAVGVSESQRAAADAAQAGCGLEE